MVGSSNKEGSSGLALQVKNAAARQTIQPNHFWPEHNGGEMFTDQGRSGEPSGL